MTVMTQDTEYRLSTEADDKTYVVFGEKVAMVNRIVSIRPNHNLRIYVFPVLQDGSLGNETLLVSETPIVKVMPDAPVETT